MDGLLRLSPGPPQRPLLLRLDGSSLLTRGELEVAAEAVADALRGAGVGPGDVVAALLSNGPAFAAWLLGTWLAGAVFAPLDPRLTAAERERTLAVAEPTAVVAGRPEHLPAEVRVGCVAEPDGSLPRLSLGSARSRSAAPRAGRMPAPGDALLLFTSGTTAEPKGVLLSATNVDAGVEAVVANCQLGPGDRALCLLPWSHGHGLLGLLLSSLRCGGSLVLTDLPGLSRRTGRASTGITWLSAVPPLLSALAEMQHGSLPDRLRFVRSASASLPTAIAARLEDRFQCPVAEAYGMTETSHQAAANPPDRTRRRLGTVGRPTGTEIRAVGDETAGGRPLEVRGPAVFSGYLGSPEATAHALTPDGWYRTGDIGIVDEDGYVRLIGRIGDVINRGGFKVAPVEIEEVLTRHPAVAAGLVTGVPHPVLGEEVGAVVVLRPGAALPAAALRSHCAEWLSPHKQPGIVRVVETLPRLPNGKPSRRLARQLLLTD